MKHIFSIVFVVLTGCAASYQQSQLTELTISLDPSKAILISTPDDGWYGEKEYRNSGKMTANAVKRAFSKHAKTSLVTNTCSNVDCVDAQQFAYLAVPSILHWEDRATEWSGKSDRLEVQLMVFDVKTGTELANATLTGKSQWASFGGDHPQDLLDKPIDEYVAALYE